MPLISVLDSYYVKIQSQIHLLNANRIMAGVANAQGWPQKQPTAGALYLLFLKSVGLPSRASQSSQMQTLHRFYCQWVWVLTGSNLTATQEGENRGDIYRTDMAIQEELRQAHFPGFTDKNNYVPDGQGNIVPQGYDPQEQIWWGKLEQAPKLKQVAGMLMGGAAISVFGWSAVNPLVNQ